MPLSLDGITISVTIMNQPVKIRYSLKTSSFGPEDIVIGGRKVPFSREENIYRKGGAVIDADQLASMLRMDNLITVIL